MWRSLSRSRRSRTPERLPDGPVMPNVRPHEPRTDDRARPLLRRGGLSQPSRTRNDRLHRAVRLGRRGGCWTGRRRTGRWRTRGRRPPAAECFVAYYAPATHDHTNLDPIAHLGKMDQVLLNSDLSLRVDRYDFHNSNDAHFWETRTITSFVYDHFQHPGELYVGSNHGV